MKGREDDLFVLDFDREPVLDVTRSHWRSSVAIHRTRASAEGCVALSNGIYTNAPGSVAEAYGGLAFRSANARVASSNRALSLLHVTLHVGAGTQPVRGELNIANTSCIRSGFAPEETHVSLTKRAWKGGG